MSTPSKQRALVEQWLEALPEDIREVFADAELQERLKEILVPHLADGFHIALVGPDGSGFFERHDGWEGFISGWDAWSAPYQDYPFAAGELTEFGDVVLVDGLQTPTPLGASEPIVMNIASLWFFEGGLLAKAEFHLDRERAHRLARDHADR